MLSRSVAVAGDYLRFVQRDPPLYPVAERPGDDRRVVGEPRGGIPDRPAALVLEFLRQVPVKERGRGGDATGSKLVQQLLVVVEALLIHCAPPAREDPWPGDREPVRVKAQRRHQRDVLAVAVIGVTGDVAGV